MTVAPVRISTEGRLYATRDAGRLAAYRALEDASDPGRAHIPADQGIHAEVIFGGSVLAIRFPVTRRDDFSYLVPEDGRFSPMPASPQEAGITAWLLDHGAAKRSLTGSGVFIEESGFDASDEPCWDYILHVTVPLSDTARSIATAKGPDTPEA